MAAISLSGFGSDQQGFSIGRTITLEAWESETDPTNNKSTVSWRVSVATTNSTWYACSLYAKVGDTVVYENSDTSANGVFPSVADSRSGSFPVTHNSGGDKSLDLYLEAWVYWHTPKSTSGSLGLTNFANSWGSPSISVSSTSKTSASRGSSNGSAALTLSRSPGSYCSVTSYSITCNGTTVSNNSPAAFSGLKNNTTYSWSASVKNNRNKTGSNSGSFYLTPIAPAAPTLSCTTGMYDAGFAASTSYDNLRKFSKWNISYGKTESYGNIITVSSSASAFIIPNLEPGTTYYYSVSVTDQNNGGAYSTALTSASTTGSFTTDISPPTNLRMSVSNVTANSFVVNYTADTLEELPITNYDIYYMHGSSPNWEDIDAGYKYIKGEGTLTDTQNWLLDALGNRDGVVDIADLSATANYIADDITHVVGDLDGNTYINNLSADNEYLFYFTATNEQGTTKSSYYRFATALGIPTLTRLDITELTPFGLSIECEAAAEGASGYWLKYRFSIDNGNTWTNWLAEDSGIVSYTWSDLQPETTYNMIVHVKAEGNYAEATTERFYTNITTPADQAKIRTKIDNNWQQGKTYIKIDGEWVKAKKIYNKIEGQWIIGTNN